MRSCERFNNNEPLTTLPSISSPRVLRRGILLVSCLLGALSCALPGYAVPPTISVSTRDFAAQPGEYFSALIVARDPDGDSLGLSAEDVPPWAHFWWQQSGSAYFAVIYGTPTASDVGMYSNIRVLASDGSTYAATPSFEITVGAPTVTLLTSASTPVINEYFSFVANASRVDGKAVDVRLENVPAWATSWTHYDGQLTWVVVYGTPSAQDLGVSLPVRIIAANGTATTLKSVEMPVAVATGSSWTLTWPAPTQNQDGSPLIDLLGYHYYVWAPGATSPVVTDVGLSGSPLRGTGAAAGLWKVAVSVYNSGHHESGLSPILPLLVR